MFIADFHIHSKYSRATSKDCVPELLEWWARRKGLDLIGSGDFTHPAWREELKERLVPAEEGLYQLRDDYRRKDGPAGGERRPRFILSGEISSIYKKNGKVRKVHNLIMLPSLEAAEALSLRLEAIGNLHSDGRPILGLDSRDLLQITLDVCPEAIFIPAHIWTPHFSLFGAYSGFDEIEECFEDLTDRIYALETGLSSDPAMNWRLSALDRFTLVSNSDAHSPANLAREANIFDTVLSYPRIARALQNKDSGEFYGTIEFFPEEGKYHYDGHRKCNVCLKPAETEAAVGVCPVCGGKITVGVLHRVEELADRGEGFVPPGAKHYESLIPLAEVVASSLGMTTASKKVKHKYEELIHALGPELFILREAPLGEIQDQAGVLITEGIRRLRQGNVKIQPGYDGEYGKVQVISKREIDRLLGQLCLFDGQGEDKQTASRGERARKGPAKKPATLPKAPANGTLDKESLSGGDIDNPYGLNLQQWQAVSAIEPAVAVIAGPGTGKTKTLVGRIAYLVEECGVPPATITAVTFTNKAAGEMRARLKKQLGNKGAAEAMTIGTFHAICLKILSGQSGKSGMPVIDETDALAVVRDILAGLALKNSPRDVLRGISLQKNGAPYGEQDPDAPNEVRAMYQAQLERYGVLDYDDILLHVLALFEGGSMDDAVDKKLTASFSYLLVDEFQDINDLQYRLIRAWSKNSKAVFVIGDPDQSIYGFRGSDPLCFERFLSDYPQVREIRLSRNYRSTPEIIRCAESVIGGKTASGQAFSLEASRESGAKVRLLEAADAFSEALFIAKEINRLVGGIDMIDAQFSSDLLKGKDPAGQDLKGFSDVAVLYRTNRQADILEQCLIKEGIPFVVAGRDDFLAEAEARRTTAFFRFLLDPGDLVSLRGYLRDTGILQGDLMQKALEKYAATEKNLKVLDGILQEAGSASVSGGFSILIELLQKYEPLVRREKPVKLIESWMKDSGLSQIPCMEKLLNMAIMYDKMPAMIHNLVLGRESDLLRSGGRRYAPDAVSLMTFHGAKGLEFPVVFLCGVTEELIPFRRNDISNLEEERRLFYVGMTRARDELILMTSRTPSPFLADIATEALIKENALPRRQIAAGKQLSIFDI